MHSIVGVWLRNLLAGSICSVLSIAFGLSYAALIFSGPLAVWVAYGVAATFLSTAIAGLFFALRSSLPFAMAGPDSSTSAVTAALVAALAERLIASGTGDYLLIPVLIVMPISSVLAGILLYGLGLARAGQVIRFVPYPVIGGFLGATGWLVALGSIEVMTDIKLGFSNVDALLNALSMWKIIAGAAVAATLFVTRIRFPNAFVLPVVLVIFVVVFYLAISFWHAPVTAMQAEGWMFKPQSAIALTLPWNSTSLAHFPWSSLPALSGDFIAVMFVTAISMLLNTSGIELATQKEADFDRDLRALGVANLLSAAAGGYVSCVSLSRSTLNFSAGATGRLAGITSAVIAASMLFVGPHFLGFVPKFVLGGVLLYFGLGLLNRWLVDSAKRLSLVEYASLLAIMLIIVKWGFIAGVSIGVVIGCATFAFGASQVNVIKFSFNGLEYRSSLDRGSDEFKLLAAHGGELQGVTLQSYLFFGSANPLYQYVKNLFASEVKCRFLIFDFSLVTGIDSSATQSFAQIKRVANAAGVRLVMVNLSPELVKAFRAVQFLTDDIILAANLDGSLEWCENAIIEANRADDDQTETLSGWLTFALGNVDYADILASFCTRVAVGTGDVIACQGTPSDSMHFILEGRVGINIDMGAGRVVRVRSLGRHTTVGEMGLLTGQPRSATITAESESVLYELRADAFEKIKAENPKLIQALLTYIIRVMTERLSFASRLIGVLKR